MLSQKQRWHESARLHPSWLTYVLVICIQCYSPIAIANNNQSSCEPVALGELVKRVLSASIPCRSVYTSKFLSTQPTLDDANLIDLLDAAATLVIADDRLQHSYSVLPPLLAELNPHTEFITLIHYIFTNPEWPTHDVYHPYINHSSAWISNAVANVLLIDSGYQSVSSLCRDMGFVGIELDTCLKDSKSRSDIQQYLTPLKSVDIKEVMAAVAMLKNSLTNEDMASIEGLILDDVNGPRYQGVTLETLYGDFAQYSGGALGGLKLFGETHIDTLPALQRLSRQVDHPAWSKVIMMARAAKGDPSAFSVIDELSHSPSKPLNAWAKQMARKRQGSNANLP